MSTRRRAALGRTEQADRGQRELCRWLDAQRRGRKNLLQQRADRLDLVELEARDVDEADEVRCVGAQRGDDLASIGMGYENGRAALNG
jgi:hypothetical protein